MRPVLMMTAAVLLACVAYSHQVETTAENENAALSDGQLVREVREAAQQNQEFVRRKRQDDERHTINQDEHPRYPEKPMQNFDEIDLYTQANWPESG